MGAWIEIFDIINKINSLCVAPLVGAWIEMAIDHQPAPDRRSHPSWVRGLKFVKKEEKENLLERRTLRGCVD